MTVNDFTKPEIVNLDQHVPDNITDKELYMAKFLISEEQKRQMHDITVITVLRSTIKALDKAIS